MFELLWFLLPVAAASGWWIGRREGPRSSRSSAGMACRPDYFKGLNYLLNEESDKALEVFVKMLEVDSETVEIHMALGSLFRRRGEVERAIRIHQNLIARPALERQQRSEALLALGRDYMQAGLFDRAETIFKDLAHERQLVPQALGQLLAIYQQEKEWDQAISIARRLGDVSTEGMGLVVAHFYCELAEAALARQDVRTARQQVRRALNSDRDCVRASILQGQAAMMQKDYKGALQNFLLVEKQDGEFLPEVIESIQTCYQQLGRQRELHEYLRESLQRKPEATIALSLARLLEHQHGPGAGVEFISEQLRSSPSLRGLAFLVDSTLEQLDHSGREKMRQISELVEQLLQDKHTYQCRSCGFSGRSLHWQCPRCKSWGHVKPVADVVWG